MRYILKIIFWCNKSQFSKAFILYLIIIVLYIMSISFHYIESNYLHYIDMNKRVDLLKKISSLDFNLLKSKDITKREYDDILDKMKNHHSDSWEVIDNNIKSISGPFLPFLVMLFVPFMNTFKSNAQKVGAIIMMLIISIIFGF